MSLLCIRPLDHDIEVWKSILSESEEEKEGTYWISGVIIRKLGGILTAFGQVSDKLDNPALIKNIPPEGYPKKSPPTLTIHELRKIFDLVIKKLYNGMATQAFISKIHITFEFFPKQSISI